MLGRLEGAKGPEWLDAQGIEQAFRATEMLGAVLRFGARTKAADLDQMDWDAAGQAGWKFTSGGESGVRTALDQFLENARMTSDGPLRRVPTYGLLYSWLGSAALSKDPGPIRGILREHILDNLDVQAGQLLLGKAVMTPRRSSIASLAASEGVHSATLENALLAKGMISEADAELPGSHVLVDYEIGKVVSEEVKRAVAITLLPQMLNASRNLVAALLDVGILTLLHDGGLSKVNIRRAVDREQVSALLTRLERIAMPVSKVPGTMVRLTRSAAITQKNMPSVLAALFGGQFRRVMRLEATPGLGGLLVDPKEIKALTSRGRPGMSASCAFMMLGIGEAAGKRLIAEKTGEAVFETVSVPGETEPWITPDAMASFRAKYVTFKSLMIEANCKQPQLKRMLADHEVKPAFDPKTLGAILYRRADLPDFLDT